MQGRLIKRYRSDAWDSGNSMTMFFEALYECGCCNGNGQIEDDEGLSEDGLIECPECEGTGELVYYE